jgi:hypothetical protein
MFNAKTKSKTFVAVAFVGGLAGLMLYGCQTTSNGPATQSASDSGASTQPAFALFGPPPKKSGVELWSDNCSRCHNMRPPQEFSAQQWEIVVHHMRLRANLTGEEAREITKFLQASN